VRNPNKFRRPFNPQFMRREWRNEEKIIQPHVQTNDQNNLVEEEIDAGYVDNPKYWHLLHEGNNTMQLIQNDYEDSLNIKKQIPKSVSNK
jgi:hypothetical protein